MFKDTFSILSLIISLMKAKKQKHNMVKKKNRWKIFLAPDLSYQSMTRLFFCWVWNSGGKELIQVFTESKSDMESYLICFMSMCQRIKKKKQQQHSWGQGQNSHIHSQILVLHLLSKYCTECLRYIGDRAFHFLSN